MRPMIEHMFGRDKFGAEFPSASQDPISVNSLRNVHSTISYIEPSRHVSVTRRSAASDRSHQGRPKLAAMPCSADS
jgi:hypothetical protein